MDKTDTVLAVIAVVTIGGFFVGFVRYARRHRTQEYPSFNELGATDGAVTSYSASLTDLPATMYVAVPMQDFWRLLRENDHLKVGGRLSKRSGHRITLNRVNGLIVIVVAMKRDADMVYRYVGSPTEGLVCGQEGRQPSSDNHINPHQAVDVNRDGMVPVTADQLWALSELLGGAYPTLAIYPKN